MQHTGGDIENNIINEKQQYTYEVPTTSPFYRHVISPLCDQLVLYVPEFVSPNTITWVGLACAAAATILLTWNPYICAALWVMYAICDNLDGKQARRTQQASVQGEFLDHVVDSATCSMLCYILSYNFAAVEHPGQISGPISLATQIPFLLACWYYNTTGKVLLGCARQHQREPTSPMMTVDEINILVVPGLTIIRPLLAHMIPAVVPIAGGRMTYGAAIAWISIVCCVVESWKVLNIIHAHTPLTHPRQQLIASIYLAYVLSVALLRLEPASTLPVFVWLCSCLILPHCHVKSIKKHSLYVFQTNVAYPAVCCIPLLVVIALSWRSQIGMVRLVLGLITSLIIFLDLQALAPP